MRRFMQQELDRFRTLDEWWEIATLVLCVEYQELPPSELGFDSEDLPWGGWEEIGDDIFGHRDGMKTYLDRELSHGQKQENDEAFWLLARRAELHISAEGGMDSRVRTHHLNIMEALRRLGAKSEDSLAPGGPLSEAALGSPDPDAIKKPCAELKEWGYTDSKEGAAGGRWLTRLGLSEINAQRPEKIGTDRQ